MSLCFPKEEKKERRTRRKRIRISFNVLLNFSFDKEFLFRSRSGKKGKKECRTVSTEFYGSFGVFDNDVNPWLRNKPLSVELFTVDALRGRTKKPPKCMNNIRSIDDHVSNKSLNVDDKEEKKESLNRFNKQALHNVGLEEGIFCCSLPHTCTVLVCVHQHNNKIKSMKCFVILGGNTNIAQNRDHPCFQWNGSRVR